MSRDPQRLADYLDHILQAIARIRCYTADMDEMAFLKTEMAQQIRGRLMQLVAGARQATDRRDPGNGDRREAEE